MENEQTPPASLPTPTFAQDNAPSFSPAALLSEAATITQPTKTGLTRRQFVQRGALLAGALTAGDAFRETESLQITRHRLVMRGLKSPCRLVQLSDLHRSWCVPEYFIARIVAETNALKPDLIALTGDFITRHGDYMASCALALKELRAPLGMVAVLGNHDYKADNHQAAPVVTEGLTWLGARLLTNRSERLDNGLRLVGVDDFREGKPDPKTAFSNVEKGEAVLAMTHNPFTFAPGMGDMCGYDCVTLAGHTHGGQVNLPLMTQYVLGGRARYKQGWYQEPGAPGRLYVSRGLGVVGLPFRFCALPEIAVFDLVPG